MFRAAISWAVCFPRAPWSSARRCCPLAAGRYLERRKAWQPSVYLGIEPDGAVKIVAHRSEMGTGCRTGLPMIVADELEADWKRVTIVQALGRCEVWIAEHRWILFRARFLRCFAERRRVGAHHAGARRCRQMGCGPKKSARARIISSYTPRVDGSCVRRIWFRWLLPPPRRSRMRVRLKTPSRVPLYRQRLADRRSERDWSPAKPFRDRRADARHGLRIHRAPAGYGQHYEELSTTRPPNR